jgi:GrpB-like predicted nucleotidyltransferase (UPF0157 family)/GNAT superfamily N-acetyltransferase
MARILIAPHDSQWPAQFEAERARLEAGLAGLPLQIEHVGSTAVPGLAAKPIIDIVVGLAADHDLDAIVAPMQGLGYSYIARYETHGSNPMPFRRYFRNRPPGDSSETVHVLCVHVGSNFWVRQLTFRDHLRATPRTAADYERLKRKLAPQFTDGNAYAEAKTEFIEGVLAKLSVRPAARRVQAGDAATWRRIRLAALADTPDAFGSTYVEEATTSMETWEQVVARSAQGFDETRLFAEDNAAACGILGTFRLADRPDTAMIVSMWVAPTHRRRGVGRMLVDAAVRWAQAGGYREVVLWATEHNEPAKALYQAIGFRLTRRTEPLRSNPKLLLEELRLPLT